MQAVVVVLLLLLLQQGLLPSSTTVAAAESPLFWKSRAVSCFVASHSKSMRSNSSSNSNSTNTKTTRMIEVEQKFVAPIHFVPDSRDWFSSSKNETVNHHNSITIHDYYYDTPDLQLLKHNHWLRHRTIVQDGKNGAADTTENTTSTSTWKSSSQWELKRGITNTTQECIASSSSVYEEIQEEAQIWKILHPFLQQSPSNINSNSHKEEVQDPSHPPFVVPPPPPLVCMAHIPTRRTSYQHRTKPHLKLDLDTNIATGYSVAEVEQLIELPSSSTPTVAQKKHSLIEQAQEEIQQVIHSILFSNNNNCTTTTPQQRIMGKLEHFLATERPDIFQICQEMGLW